MRCQTPSCDNETTGWVRSDQIVTGPIICIECADRLEEEKTLNTDNDYASPDFSDPDVVRYQIQLELNQIPAVQAIQKHYDTSFDKIEAMISIYFHTKRNR